MEKKSGSLQELQQDIDQCGLHPDTGQQPLEAAMAAARMKVDDALQGILQESHLPLYIFDYLVTSVLCDIRKADLDTLRLGMIPPERSEKDEKLDLLRQFRDQMATEGDDGK